MKYLKKFNTQDEYQSYIKSAEALRPNVSLVDDAVNFHPYTDPFYIDMIEDGTIKFSGGGYYRKNAASSWKTFYSSTTISATAGDRIYFKKEADLEAGERIGTFTITGSANVGGNAMSLLYGDDYHDQQFVPEYAFASLLNNATSIIDASKLLLPATQLSRSCYAGLFNGCVNLLAGPKLVASELANFCYSSMYNGCSSLASVHDMPTVESVPEGAYSSMYNGCSSLKKGPKMGVKQTVYVAGCSNMFTGCTALETAYDLTATAVCTQGYDMMYKACSSLVTAPQMKLERTSGQQVMREMFFGCSSLVTGPDEISVDVLEIESCFYMFYNCSSLTKAPNIKMRVAAPVCCESMFRGCSSLVEPPSISFAEYRLSLPNLGQFNNMFNGCISLKSAPKLPYAKLFEKCYYRMFRGCSNLNHIEMTALDVSALSCLKEWVDGVATTGTFIKAAGVEIPTGINGIPEGWTVEEVAV